MQKKKQEFETFNDGICDIYNTDDEGNTKDKIATYRFGHQIVGTKRFYEAMAQKVNISELIKIPMQRWTDGSYQAIINDSVYEIIQTQHKQDKRPPVTILTLKRIGMKGG